MQYGAIRHLTAAYTSYVKDGVTLDHVVVMGGPIALVVQGSGVRIVDSEIIESYDYPPPNYGIMLEQGDFTMERSVVRTRGTGLWLNVAGPDVLTRITNSTVEAGNVAIDAASGYRPVSATASRFVAPTLLSRVGVINPNFSATFSASELAGGRSTLVSGIDRIVNCWDGSLNGIPNQ